MSEQAEPATSTSTGIPTELQEANMPVLFGHCVRVYEAMDAEAEQTPQGKVYVGHLTHLVKELGLGQPYYTHVTRKLKAMDCIRQIKRGAGEVPSKWLLMQSPSPALWALPDSAMSRTSQQKHAKDMVAQQMRDMNRRLSSLETWARNQGYRPQL